MASRSFTFIVPALNENEALSSTVDEILQVLKEESVRDYEILIFDDGSSDRTGAIADSYADRFKEIRVFHNPSPLGIGYSFKTGIAHATKDYYMLVHGDNEIPDLAVRSMLQAAGMADFTIAYVVDDHRPRARQILSVSFTRLVNFLFGLSVRYYNGPNLFPVRLLREIRILTNGHAFMAETIIRLAKRGYSYNEIGFRSRRRSRGRSKAFRIQNVLSVFRAILGLKVSMTLDSIRRVRA